jgi:hypothetical protein
MAATSHHAAGRLPDFLIIGAAKSGTSTLYEYLTAHPEIFMSPIKEPCFFDSDVAWDKGLDWYRGLFREAAENQLCGEASTNYTRWPQVPDVPQRIAEIMPDVKLIYVLRHPVERAYSHYVHRHTREVYPGEPFRRSFEEFVEEDPMCLDSSDYAMQIDQYLSFFPRDSLLILRLEDLKRDPGPLLRRVLRFLGVDEDVELLGGGEILANPGGIHGGKLRQHVTAPLRRVPAIRKLAYAVPQSWRDLVYSLLRRTSYADGVREAHTAPPMREETRAALLERFRESNRFLAERFGLDVADWGE